MNAHNEDLTPGERRFLERQQEAATEGVTLPEYYRSHGLSLKSLYAVRKRLVSKGVVPPALPGRPPGKPTATAGQFVAVRLAVPNTTQGVPGRGCRLRSPSGWLIECDGLPDPTWLGHLMRTQP
jgi:hypothetical protein